MYANIKTNDLFLTSQRQSAVSSEFLTDDSHFTLSNDESETEEDEGIDAKAGSNNDNDTDSDSDSGGL